jgi:hypothetical protein
MATTKPCAFLELLTTPSPPELGSAKRAGVEDVSTLNNKLQDVLERLPRLGRTEDLIRATVLLWHDHLDAAHEIAQNIETADGSYLHGIMHRREPDYGNAKYWFRRVGKHPCFAELAGRATALLRSKSADTLRAGLVPSGEWDAFAFIDACETAASRPDSDPQTHLLRCVQAVEFEVLLESFCR